MPTRIFHYPIVSEYDSARSFSDIFSQVGDVQICFFVDSSRQKEVDYVDKISAKLDRCEDFTIEIIKQIYKENLQAAKRKKDDLALATILFIKDEVWVMVSGGEVILDRNKTREVMLRAKYGEIKVCRGGLATSDVFLLSSQDSYKFLKKDVEQVWLRTPSITDSVLNLQELVKKIADKKKKSLGVMLVSVVMAELSEKQSEFCMIDWDENPKQKNIAETKEIDAKIKQEKRPNWFKTHWWLLVVAVMLVATLTILTSFLIKPGEIKQSSAREVNDTVIKNELLIAINAIEKANQDDNLTVPQKRQLINENFLLLQDAVQRQDLDPLTITWLEQEITRLQQIVTKYAVEQTLSDPALFYDIQNTANQLEKLTVNFSYPKGIFYDKEASRASTLNFDALRFKNYEFNIPTVSEIWWWQDQPLVQSGENFYLFVDASESSRLQNMLTTTLSDKALTIENDNLWIIDEKDKAIYLSQIDGDRITEETIWYEDDLGVEKIMQVLAIDDELYLLDNNNTIVKFVAGNKVDFVGADWEQTLPLGTLELFSDNMLDYLYGFDKENGKVVIIDKNNGDVIYVYHHPKWQEMDDFWVVQDGTQIKLFGLTNTKIYLFTI